MPVVTVGLNVSPHWSRSISPPMDFKTLGYEPIIVNNTSKRVGELYQEALVEAYRHNSPGVLINAWNEWSEGMYLIPDTYHGDSFLKAIKAANSAANTVWSK